jgi:transcriptional regulator with XRE-family HTH domain
MTVQFEEERETPPEKHGAPDYSLDEVLLSVGERVRNYRRVRGLTLSDLSEATGLSSSMLSTIERGQTGISVASIHAIAQALDVSITSLFQSTGPGDPVVRCESQRREVTTGGAIRTLILADPETRLEFHVYDFAPGTASAASPTVHNGMEYGVNLGGRIEVEIDGQKHVLDEGDAIRYSTRSGHLMRNTGSVPARGVWVNISRL